ncbi:MAG: HAD-IIIC family phosphatase [Formivibrio sp.]|nr:HAD-IIIC family phosphatase [Formivibrio sp.]
MKPRIPGATRRYRKITPYEWLYLSAAPHFPPFVIQLRIALSVLPPLALLESALDTAAAANPGARLIAQDGWWLDSGQAPGVRTLPGTEVFSLVYPALHASLPCHAVPPLEVLYWPGCGLIFRCAHALMDAGGLLFFAQETLRALRGEPVLGTASAVSDYPYLSGLQHPRRRASLRLDQSSPLGSATPKVDGFVWETRFVLGSVTSAGARICTALAGMIPATVSSSVCRIMVPVDLRQPDPSLRSTANFSNPLWLEFPLGTTWRDSYRDILAALGRHDERAIARSDACLPYVPQRLLGRLTAWLHAWQVRQNRYLFAGMSSNVGPVSLDEFRTQDCTPAAVALLPFNVPGSALSLLTIQHDHGLEIAASCPMATGGEGRLGALLDRLCAGLAAQPPLTVSLAPPRSLPTAPHQQIMIASSFVAEPLARVLAFWMQQFNLPTAIEFAPYNQVFQTLVAPDSLFWRNTQGVNVLLLRVEDWLRDAPNADHVELLPRLADDFLAALSSASKQSAVPLLVWIAPAASSMQRSPASQAALEATLQALLAGLGSMLGICLIAPDALPTLYPVVQAEDAYADQLGHVPYTQAMYAALATLLARQAIALRSPPSKVIVLDCDNTLWQGVCAEAGPTGVALTPPFQALQEFMLAQHAAGMLLCLCSKNSPEDVEAVFEHHSGMLLNPAHFIASRINWQAKSANLQSLARELQLSLDSFIFIDDNPVECAEVQAHCPQVLVLQLPAEIAHIPLFLQHVWAFDRPVTTEAAQQRSAQYRQNQQRETLRSQVGDFAAFLASLQLQVAIAPMLPAALERVAELTRRTNQFNLRPQPCQAAQIQALAQTQHCLTVEVDDRFGAYGLTGVLMYRLQAEVLRVDTFLLSCRVLGRGVEHRVMAVLGEIARDTGCRQIVLPFRKTAKNQPMLDFLTTVATEQTDPLTAKQTDPAGLQRFTLTVERAVQLQPAAPVVCSSSVAPESAPVASDPQRLYRSALIQQIAEAWTDVPQIMQASGTVTPSPKNALPDSMEAVLAKMVIDLLEHAVDTVPLDQSLSDLGLSSLQMVLLLSAAAQRFVPDLPSGQLFADLDEFAREPTLRSLVRHLHRQRAESSHFTRLDQPVGTTGGHA